jgi:hypothetical protein
MDQHCAQCGVLFLVADQDLSFYDRVSPVLAGIKYAVPPPTCCPRCRQQRRLAWRNEHYLYRRNCDLCRRSIVSAHRPAVPYPVYCVSCWWGDGWNPLDFGLALDSGKSFLQQYKELQSRVPQLAIQNDNGIGSENSEYCYDISRAKDCYRLVGSWYVQECHYSLNVNRSKFVVDCNTTSINCELVYECLDSQRLYNCAYLQNCEGCSDCFFGVDLKGCRQCICCHGLRQKEHYIFNQPHTPESYQEALKSFRLGSFSQVESLRTKFEAWVLKRPRRAANIQHCDDCIGNNLFNCREVLGYSVFNSEYSKFIDRSDGPKNCYDIINTGGPQWCYDCVTPDDSYLVIFSVWCWKSKNILYSDNCHSCDSLCGCISMRRNDHCILNVQYSEEDYDHRVGEILRSLERERVWGELLPISLSPYAYNESAAQEYYPLRAEDVAAKGWRWTDELPDLRGVETIGWQSVPDDIEEAPESLVNEIFACINCGKNYKLIPSELKIYKKLPAPIPRRCPQCRHLRRFRKKTPTAIWQRECAKCRTLVYTAYSPEHAEIIYCDRCYFNEVY